MRCGGARRNGARRSGVRSGPAQAAVQRDGPAVGGVRQVELPGVQPQALQAQALGPPAVERPLAVRGVAQQQVGDVLEVPPDLVAPPGGGLGQHQRGARGGEARVAGLGQLQPRQGGQARVRGLGRGIGRRVVGAQGVGHLGLGRRPAAHQGQVALAHRVAGEGVGQGARGRGVQGHGEHAAGALVEPVHRVDVLAELVAQRLHDEARLARVQPRAVHEPARGLVDGDQVLVAPEQGQAQARRPGVSWMVPRPESGGASWRGATQYTHRPRSQTHR